MSRHRDPRPVTYRNYYSEGKEIPNVVVPIGFRIRRRDTHKRNVITHLTPAMLSCDRGCPLHGVSCMGHELSINNVDLPGFSPSRRSGQSELADIIQEALYGSSIRGMVRRDSYMKSKEIRKRSIHKDFRVKCKVITGVACLLRSSARYDVTIPRVVANKVRIPRVINGVVRNVPVTDGMRGILSRSPVITHQSLISVTIRVTDDPMYQMVIAVGPLVIDKQGGDFDGDQISLCIPTDEHSLHELNVMRNFYIRHHPYPQNAHESVSMSTYNASEVSDWKTHWEERAPYAHDWELEPKHLREFNKRRESAHNVDWMSIYDDGMEVMKNTIEKTSLKAISGWYCKMAMLTASNMEIHPLGISQPDGYIYQCNLTRPIGTPSMKGNIVLRAVVSLFERFQSESHKTKAYVGDRRDHFPLLQLMIGVKEESTYRTMIMHRHDGSMKVSVVSIRNIESIDLETLLGCYCPPLLARCYRCMTDSEFERVCIVGSIMLMCNTSEHYYESMSAISCILHYIGRTGRESFVSSVGDQWMNWMVRSWIHMLPRGLSADTIISNGWCGNVCYSELHQVQSCIEDTSLTYSSFPTDPSYIGYRM